MRRLWLFALCLLAILIVPRLSKVLSASKGPEIKLDAQGAEPRDVEDATRAAILRDYAASWQNLAAALDGNRADILDSSFVGMAREDLGRAVLMQKKTGLHRRYIDRGHRLQAVFYSYDGSAMQLKDTAQLEVQLLDGDRVVATEAATTQFVVLMTPAENSWKVRALQAVQHF